MPTFSGKVEALSTKQVNTKRGPTNVYAIKLNEDWIDFAFDPPTVQKGDTVELDATTNSYGKLVVSKGTVKKLGSAPATSSGGAQASSSKYTGFPVPLDDKGQSICRQNALTAAVNFHTMSGDGTPEQIIETAAFFANWTTGHAETEVAETMLRQMYPDLKMNKEDDE